MARSKSLLFPTKQQILANYGLAISHPVRIELLRRLLTAKVLSYNELVADIPLATSTLEQHFRMLERTGFMMKGMFPSTDAGYSLDRMAYKVAVAAHHDELEQGGIVVRRLLYVEDAV